MKPNELEKALAQALMIVGGYAFLPNAENVSIVSLNTPHRSVLIRPNGEVLETNMEDVELDVVSDFWQKNRRFYEEMSHA